MIFYGDSFKTDKDEWITGDIKSTIKLRYDNNYDKEVFNKISNLFKNDKNVKIEIINIDENKK